MAIKLVFFDYGDLLVPSSIRCFSESAERFRKARGINPEEHDRAWGKVSEAASIGKISAEVAQQRVFELLGKTNDDARDWVKHCEELLMRAKPYSCVVKTLLRLKEAGFKTAVLSDSVHSAEFKKKVIESWGASVDEVYCSCGLGYKKPNARAYESVLEHFNVKPSEAVFVGHEKEEIDGAKALGIKTIGFNVKDDSEPDAFAENFIDIPGIVAGFR